MINFSNTECLFNDRIGFGFWLTGHAYEHKQFINICQTLTNPVTIPDYNFRSWYDDPGAIQSWLQNHEYVHKILRQVCNVTGDDLSLVDFSKEDDWYNWMDSHKTEHETFEAAFGIT